MKNRLCQIRSHVEVPYLYPMCKLRLRQYEDTEKAAVFYVKVMMISYLKYNNYANSNNYIF